MVVYGALHFPRRFVAYAETDIRKSWVLLADYKDCALERNSVAFYLGQQILGSDGYYCSDFRQVEVHFLTFPI